MPTSVLSRLMLAGSSGGGNSGSTASSGARVKVVFVAPGARRRARKARRLARKARLAAAAARLEVASSVSSADALLDAMIAEEEEGGAGQGLLEPEWRSELEEEEEDERQRQQQQQAPLADEETFGNSAGGKSGATAALRKWDEAAADAAGRRVLDREALRRELASFALADLSDGDDDEDDEQQGAAEARAAVPAAGAANGSSSSAGDSLLKVKKTLASALFGSGGNSNSSSPRIAAAPAHDDNEPAGAAFFGGSAALAKAGLEGGGGLSGASEAELKAARERNQFGAGDSGAIPEDVFSSVYSTRVESATRRRWLAEAERIEREILAAGGEA